MKLFKNLFLILTLTSVLISCSKDDDTPKVLTSSEKIIGNWELTEFTDIKTVTTTLNTEVTTATTTSTGKLFDGSEVNFTNSPKDMTSTGDFVMVIKSKVDMEDEEMVEEKVTLSSTFDSGTWIIENENLLTIKRDAFDYLYKITEVTESALKIETDSELIITSGASETKTIITTSLVFKKK